MPFFPKTRDEIINDFIEELSSNTDITQLSPGGKMRFLLETLGTELEAQNSLFNDNLFQSFVKYAGGRFLDFFGDMFDLPRNESTHAESDDQTFMFYVNSGTFGSINSGVDFVVPAGTTVATVALSSALVTPGLNQQEVIEYKTSSAALCSAARSFVFVPIRATVEGSVSNVSRNVLNSHPFTSYTENAKGLLKCTNRFAISNGEDREDDESYRFRLSQVFKARSMGVEASIRLAALSVPGVSDIQLISAEQGPGSYSLYVQAVTPTTPPKLLTEVSNSVSLVSSFGVRPYVLAPEPVGLELICGIEWNKNTTAQQKADGYNIIRDAIESYINDLTIGESLDLAQLIDTVLLTEARIRSIGINKNNRFEEVYIYRGSPQTESGITKEKVTGDEIVPLQNERIILETSGVNRGLKFLEKPSG